MHSIQWRAQSVQMFVLVATLGVPATAAMPGASGAAPGATQTLDELAARVASGTWDTFSAEITVRHGLVRASGDAAGPEPTAERFQWQRAKTANGWKSTTMRTRATPVTARARHGVVALEAPPTVVRIEDAEDGTPVRAFSSNGSELSLPSAGIRGRVGLSGPSPLDSVLADVDANARPRGKGREWIEGFVLSAEARGRRQAAIARELGRPVTVSTGVKQYTRRDGDIEREWLVDDREGVVLESNVVQHGTLVDHASFSYDRTSSGALVKRRLRLERLVSPADGTRSVTEIEYSNLRLTSEGGR